MVASAILNGVFVGVFAFTKSFWILFVTRAFVGFFQVMFVIYFPVWIDLCAPPKSSTMWISCFFLTVPMGIIVGYGITIGFQSMFTADDSYKWGFAVQTVLMIIPIALAMIFFPAHYYEKPIE